MNSRDTIPSRPTTNQLLCLRDITVFGILVLRLFRMVLMQGNLTKCFIQRAPKTADTVILCPVAVMVD